MDWLPIRVHLCSARRELGQGLAQCHDAEQEEVDNGCMDEPKKEYQCLNSFHRGDTDSDLRRHLLMNLGLNSVKRYWTPPIAHNTQK